MQIQNSNQGESNAAAVGLVTVGTPYKSLCEEQNVPVVLTKVKWYWKLIQKYM